MIIYFVFSSIVGLFRPNDAVMINQKLQGYWMVVVDETKRQAPEGETRVVKFNQCKKQDRLNQQCTYEWCYMPDSLITKNKLDKVSKKQWQACNSYTYYIDKKKNKETKRVTIHLDQPTEISFNIVKKELIFYNADAAAVKLVKLK